MRKKNSHRSGYHHLMLWVVNPSSKTFFQQLRFMEVGLVIEDMPCAYTSTCCIKACCRYSSLTRQVQKCHQPFMETTSKFMSPRKLQKTRKTSLVIHGFVEKVYYDTKVLFDQLTKDAMKLMKDGDYNAYDEKQEVSHRESGAYEELQAGKPIQFIDFHINFSQFEGGNDRYPDDIDVVCEEWCAFVTSFVFD